MIKKYFKKFRDSHKNNLITKRACDYADLFFNSHITLYPDLIETPKWDRTLILTPHADDETLGCGGFINKASKNGKKIKVVLYSDNSESINNHYKEEIITLRSKEFSESMKVLGVDDSYEFRFSASDFHSSTKTVEKTVQLILSYSPDAILLPSFIDNHEEHRELNIILMKALSGMKMNPDILLFEVWTPFSPNLVLDITDVIDTKINAIGCYKSQLGYIDYISTIIGLNRYRSITCLKGKGYCEGFVVLTSAEFIKIVKKYI